MSSGENRLIVNEGVNLDLQVNFRRLREQLPPNQPTEISVIHNVAPQTTYLNAPTLYQPFRGIYVRLSGFTLNSKDLLPQYRNPKMKGPVSVNFERPLGIVLYVAGASIFGSWDEDTSGLWGESHMAHGFHPPHLRTLKARSFDEAVAQCGFWSPRREIDGASSEWDGLLRKVENLRNNDSSKPNDVNFASSSSYWRGVEDHARPEVRFNLQFTSPVVKTNPNRVELEAGRYAQVVDYGREWPIVPLDGRHEGFDLSTRYYCLTWTESDGTRGITNLWIGGAVPVMQTVIDAQSMCRENKGVEHTFARHDAREGSVLLGTNRNMRLHYEFNTQASITLVCE